MIPYEEICQALDRYNAHRRNEAELVALEQSEGGEGGLAPNAGEAFLGGGASYDDSMAQQPAAESIFQADSATEVDQMVYKEAATTESQAVEVPFGGLTDGQPPKETTHEIDVDDVLIDDKLSSR